MSESQLDPGIKFVVADKDDGLRIGTAFEQRYQLVNFQGKLCILDTINDYELSPIDKDRAKEEYMSSGVKNCPFLTGITTANPDNFNFKPIVDNKLNGNHPLPYLPPIKGTWKTIESTLKHVFGEHLDDIKMYHKIMLEHPQVKLPVIVLLSKENETGKSSVLELTAKMMGKNSTKIRPSELGKEGKYNGRFASKQFGYIDEQSTGKEKWEAMNIIKDIVTSEEVVTEEKNQRSGLVQCNLKLMMASNEVLTAIPAEVNDTRIWPILVPPLKKNVMMNRETYKEMLYSEIPAYMYHLVNELEYVKSPHRLHFDHKMFMNSLKIDIINNSKSTTYESILEVLHDVTVSHDKRSPINDISFKIKTIQKILGGRTGPIMHAIQDLGFVKKSSIIQNKNNTKWHIDIDQAGNPYLTQVDKPIRGYTMEISKIEQLLE